MPVIREQPWAPDASKHPELVGRLATELRSAQPFGQPLVLVRTFPHTGFVGVTVVWDDWDTVDELDRAAIILNAFEQVYGKAERDRVVVPIGFTEPEAVDAGVLPFAVRPLLRNSDPSDWFDRCRQAMIDLGASDLWKKGYPRLRLPTQEMAEQYVRELIRHVPGSEVVWSTEVQPEAMTTTF